MGFLVVLCIAVSAVLFSHSAAALNALTDEEALLSFKTLITADPSNILSTWNSNLSPCNWTGVMCDEIKQRVVGLDLQGLGLSGIISPYLANLSYLHSLQLQKNQFEGTIPDRIGDLSRLHVLNISANHIQGTIPRNISRCSELIVLDLTGNEISGVIPIELGRLSKLQVVKMNRNRLSGAIPPSIGNLSSLTTLKLATNSLSGTIPSDFGRLQNLQKLQLGINNLTGIVPPSLYNISSLVSIALASNRLWGEIPSDVGDTLRNLLEINFGVNDFTGAFPGSLHNLTKIQSIQMAQNFLVGSIPPGLGNLPDLRVYDIGFNRIVSSGEAGLNFITSLTNSTHLEFLALDDNLLEGVIPESIGNLSTLLTKLYMGGNRRIYGNIPASIGRLRGLALLNLSHNSLSGEIPSEIGQLKELQLLGLAGNKIAGEIPASLGNLSKLNELELFGNELVGRIPTTFNNFQSLLSLDLSKNRLNGSIPIEVFGLSSLSILLNLSKNSLNGPLPREIGNLENIVTVDLSDNALFGSIPDSIGNCKSLEELFMSNNLFSGLIPSTLGEVKGLETLDLSSNQLSGPIPDDLQRLQALQFLNLSFNNLEGEVPNDGAFRNLSRVHLDGNSKLCFPSACKSNQDLGKISIAVRSIIATAGSIAFCLLVALLLCISFNRRKNSAKMKVSSDLFKGQHQMISYEELRTATGNFDQTNLIGSGSFGSVYKGILRDGRAIAVKVLDLGQTGASKSFWAECEALRNVRHRNLLKLITSCSSVDNANTEFMALVYEFMGNGSLEDWCRGRRRHTSGDGLNVVERLNVAIDVAYAMDYLHNDCEAPVVHCDLKPSNVLLDKDMTAKIGDFGVARLLVVKADDQQSSITNTYGLKGSIGYIPPEYGLGGKPSTRGDVYSYGVMLLELFTGRSPTHEAFTGDVSIAKWVKSSFPDNTTHVLDPDLLLLMDDVHHEGQLISSEIRQECLVSIIGVGLSCVIESPEARISMRNIVHKLKNIRDNLHKSSPGEDKI